MLTTTLTGPPAAYMAPVAPPRQQEQRATRPVESTSSSGGGSQAASVPSKPKDTPVTFPPAPGLIDLIMRAQDAKDAEREVRQEVQSSPALESYAQAGADPPSQGASVDAYS
ncbi:MAG: hypothetical protein ACKVS9_03865 [Phycisphaerae bacterium]